MRGIPVVDGQFAGTAFDWVHPFPIFTGLGMVVGYALLGASWLVFKGEGAFRDWAYARSVAGGRGPCGVGPGLRRIGDDSMPAPSRRAICGREVGDSSSRFLAIIALLGAVAGARCAARRRAGGADDDYSLSPHTSRSA